MNNECVYPHCLPETPECCEKKIAPGQIEADNRKQVTMSNCQICGHSKASYIYEEGACRPGFACDCQGFTLMRQNFDRKPTWSEVAFGVSIFAFLIIAIALAGFGS